MKLLLTSVIVLFLFGCRQATRQSVVVLNNDTTAHAANYWADPDVDSSLLIKEDSLVIATPGLGNLVFSGKEFNFIVSHYPELYKEIPYSPDEAYAIWCERPKDFGDTADYVSFGSEQGHDAFCRVYAWLLMKKTGDSAYAVRRKKLLVLYQEINDLFGYLAFGGTYFGHQASRIHGYVEHDIYLLSRYQDEFAKRYDFQKQQRLYIASLRQIIEDEVNADLDNFGASDKEPYKRKLNRIVDNIERSITDYFYLDRTQRFQYAHY